MDLDHLPGEAGAQVARGAVHDSQERRQVVRQLGAGAVAGVVDVGEVVLEVDPAADGEDGLEDPGQDTALGVILGGVIRGEERAAVEEQAAAPLAASHDGDGVGRVSQLGPGLRQVFGTFLDVLAGGREGERQGRRHEPPAAFVCVPLAGRIDGRPRRLELLAVRRGNPIEVGEGHRVVAGVVVAADEDRIVGHDEVPPRQVFADPRVVQDLGDGAAVGAARRAAAGAAVVGRVVRVVQAVRAMPDQ